MLTSHHRRREEQSPKYRIGKVQNVRKIPVLVWAPSHTLRSWLGPSWPLVVQGLERRRTRDLDHRPICEQARGRASRSCSLTWPKYRNTETNFTLAYFKFEYEDKKAYLEVLLSVENNRFGLDFTILDVYFVAAQYDWNVLTDAGQITMPVGNILVGNAWCDVEHNNGALTW